MPHQYAIGDLVEYNFRKVSGAKCKYGIVMSVKDSTVDNWNIYVRVRWSDGYQDTYDARHLILVAKGE